MDDLVLARVFEPFFSTEAPDVRAGLGLSMVGRLVADHGGTMELQSAPDEGTRVEIWIPA